MSDFDFQSIEKKWQKRWAEEDVFNVLDNSEKTKYYVLEMYPYPSGSGLHMGHALNYTIGDIMARFKRMQGFNVLYPMGYDSFGLPAENAAIKIKEHPRIFTENAIANFIRQQKSLGLSYDWTRKIMSHDPEYYKWNQFFFLKFLKQGLIYRKNAPVNWCPKCNSVLANEQVHNGKCWRHEDTNVEIKFLEQWFIKTTKYAEELLKMIDKLSWPKRIKIMQKNWIGKSYGTEILFDINGEKWPIFTTRPDTIFGVTFMVISSKHPRLMDLVTAKEYKKVEEFLKKLNSVSEKNLSVLDKEGVFTGSYAINPINNEKIPIYAGNFVLPDYGSGMIMAVPAHDQRDFDFAKKYNLKIKFVIHPDNSKEKQDTSKAYTGRGKLINSGDFNDLINEEAKEHITIFLEKNKLGKKTVQYKIKDWLISRQRYWGTPIPVVYCDDCGIVPLSENNLPVLLPDEVTFGKGNPLLTNEEWLKTKCPKCGKQARRETDTMDTFFDSSWYYLRYCDNDNRKEPFSLNKVAYWMPVDIYIGGAEHACMHLIFARFFTKALRDLGYLKFDEPFPRLFNQGMIHKGGFVMSKSRGNVVNPSDVIKKYSADSLRLALVSLASPDSDINWDDNILIGNHKFLIRVWNYFNDVVELSSSSSKIESKSNKILKEVTNQIENLRYNLAIIKIRELFSLIEKEKKTSREILEKLLKMLHPFCPHITEELWEKLGHKEGDFISLSSWPIADDKKINNFFDKQEEYTNQLILDIINVLKIIESKGKKAEKIYLYVVPGQKDFYDLIDLKRRINKPIQIFESSNSSKYDPKEVSKKAKPGKPAIYIE